MAEPYDFWLLDLDGTLVDVEPGYVTEVMARVGDRLGVDFDADDAAELWYDNPSRRAAVLDRHGLAAEEFWQAFHDIDDPSARAAATYVYDDASDVVPGLAGPVGLVTHCQPAFTEQVLERTGIGEWFNAVVCCGDETGWKPDPRPLELAMADLGVDGEGVMVGDAPTDVEAARNAGLDGIHVDRDHTVAEPGADRRVGTLTAVLA